MVIDDVAQRHIGEVLALDAAEVGEGHPRHFVVVAEQRQAQADLLAVGVHRLQVPVAAFAPAEADGAARHHQALAALIPGDGLPLGVVGLREVAVEVAGAQLLARHQAAVLALLQFHQDRHVGVAADVVGEVGAGLFKVEFLEDHVAHGDGKGRVGALLGAHPLVAELGNLRVVRGDGDGLGALVAHLGEEVRVGGAGLRNVGTPGDDVAGVVPVGGLGHVGLLAPHLWRGRRQVAVPVVEAQADPADQRQVAGARGVGNHRHGRDRREAGDAVRAVLLDGVDVGGGDQRLHLVPVGADEAAAAADGLVLPGLLRVLDDARPGLHRVAVGRQRLAPQLHQRLAHHRVLQAVGAVQVPGVAGPARAAARFVVGQVGTGARVVGLLGFPGHQAVLHVDLPAARTGAVHPVGGAGDLVELPALAVAVLPGAALVAGFAVAAGEFRRTLDQVAQAVDEEAHVSPPWLGALTASSAPRRYCGCRRTRSARCTAGRTG
ncbi:hypothetical protein D9M71_262640 [compost metagenome]